MNEQISILKGYISHLEYMKKNADEFFDREQADKDIEAFKAAIEALAIEALEQEPCEDAISRSDMLDAVGHGTTYTSEDLQRIIKGLLPVNPQPKTGHWIYDYTTADGHRTYHCSVCGCYLKPKHSEPLNSFKWCSLCGAKMIEPQAESEG